MDAVTLSSKYQLVVPKSIRESMGFKPGQKFMPIAKHGSIQYVPVPTLKEMRGIARGADTSNIREKVDRF